jgi:hypothetical protein
MIASDFCQWLENNNFGTYGDDVFDTFMQDTPDNLILVEDVSSFSISESSSLKVDLYSIKITARNINTLNAKNIIKNIHKKFIGFGGDPLVSGGDIVSMTSVSSPPYCLGKDEKARTKYTVTYDVRVQSTGDTYRL